jgi:hypothetical protein
MRLALLLFVLLLAGCGGGDTYAGLSREQAADSAKRAFADALGTARIRQQIEAHVVEDADGAMGRAGGTPLGISRVQIKSYDTALQRASLHGSRAWLERFELRANGNDMQVCVYVWDIGSYVTVKRVC